jgi:hypothetical protein
MTDRHRCAAVAFARLDAAQTIINERQLQTTPQTRLHIRSLLGSGCPPAKAVALALKADAQ